MIRAFLETPARALLRLLCLVALMPAFLLAGETAAKNFDIPAGKAEATLRQFAAQSGVELAYATDQVKDVATSAVAGEHTPLAALEKMLAGTPLLVVKDSKPGAFALRREGPAGPNARRAIAKNSDRPGEKTEEKAEKPLELPTFEVMGSKLLNMDIKRSRDDAQPYVVFEREKIEQSGALNLEEFLKQRLTMNTAARSSSQVATQLAGNTSSVNLRGLGASQTLILIDGHRAAGALSGGPASGAAAQADINGIPLSAIERIEVLPTTASGIYGGSATGGVINIILRRDYAGAELKATYDNTFDTDTAIRRLDFAAGFTLEHGKTSVLLAASYSDRNELWAQDRNIIQDARQTIVRNLGGNPTTVAGTFPVLGATVNIQSANGSSLFGSGTSSITFLPAGYTSAAGLAPLLANACRFNLDLADTAQSSIGAGGGGRQAFGSVPTTESLTLTVRRQFSPALQIFLELAGSNNSSRAWSNLAGPLGFTIAANAPNNPFGQTIRAVVPIGIADSFTTATSTERRVVAGAIFKLPRSWQAEVDYIWSRSRYSAQAAFGLSAAATTAISTGALNILRDPALIDFSAYLTPGARNAPYYATLENPVLRFSGPLLELPAGTVGLSSLVEYRKESLSDGYQFTSTATTYSPSRSQSLGAVYLEAKVPIIAALDPATGVRGLELQLAGRYDDYTLNGANVISGLPAQTFPAPATVVVVRAKNQRDSINPTAGVRYVPLPGVVLRASYGTGFLPPTLNQLAANSPVTQTASAGIADPRRGNTALIPPYTTISGGNANLRPEESESWSAGIVLTPAFAPRLRLSLDYTRIEKTDNIGQLSTQQLIDNEALLPGRITRGANLPGDQSGWAGPITALDNTVVNVSRASLEAYDAALDYEFDLKELGRLGAFAAATWQPHLKTRLAPTAPELENAGVGFGSISTPLKFKANAGASWKRGAWTFNWVARYFDSYVVVHPTLSTSATTYQRQGSNRVASQIYHDISISRRFGEPRRLGLGFLNGLEIQVGARNILNAAPRFDVNNTTDLYSGFGDPRLASYYVSVKCVR